jgi:hypothetical protein
VAHPRDLVSLAQAAASADPARPARRQLTGDDRRVIQRQLPAAVDAAVADPAHGRLAGIIDGLATTLASQLARQETGALPLIRTALTGAEGKAAGRRIAQTPACPRAPSSLP